MGKAISALKSQEMALEKARKVVEKAKIICLNRGWRLIASYLVGSRARGDYTVESDVDMVLVVDGLEKMNRLERLEAFKYALEPGVDLFIYTPSEWFGEESVWIKELKKEAVEIKQ